ncbi:MAG TPA: MFS transporter [Trebonia sp.]
MSRRWGGLLRHRDFRLLWIGETVSQTGGFLATVLVPLLAVTVLRASTFDVAALTAAAWLPWLVIGLPAGAWVDRWPQRPLMIACDVVSALLFTSLPVAAWLGVLAFWQLAAVALLAGVAEVFFTTAYQVYLPSIVPAGDLMEGNAKLQGSASAALIGGRGAAGALAQTMGAAPAILLNAVSFLVSAACLLRIGARGASRRGPVSEPAGEAAIGKPAAADKTTILAEVTAGVRFVASDPYLRPLTAYAIAGNLFYSGYVSLIVLFLARVAGFSSGAVGALMAVAGVGGVAGALVTKRLCARFGSARVLLLVAASNAAGLLVPLTHAGYRVIWYVAGAVVLNAGILAGNIIAGSFRQQYYPPRMLGRVVAGMRFLAFGAIPVGALLAGALGTALGVRDALWVSLGANALTGAVLCVPSIQAARDLPSGGAVPADVGAGALARSLESGHLPALGNSPARFDELKRVLLDWHTCCFMDIFSLRSATWLGAMVVAAGALGTAGCSSSSSSSSSNKASSGSSASASAGAGLAVTQIVFGTTMKHKFQPNGKGAEETGSLSKPDDLAALGGNIYVGFQNGVGPQGEPATSGNLDSTLVEFTPSGHVVQQWDMPGKIDGLGTDTGTGQIVATVNEDANSSLYTVSSGSSTATHYTYSQPLPHKGGTDNVAYYDGKLLISASAPGTSGKAPASAPAVFAVTLNSGSKVANVAPFFADDASATAVNGPHAGQKVALALTDPDSSENVPSDSPSFSGDYMLDSQGDEELIFAPASGQNLQVLKLSNSIDDSAWATSASGTLYTTDPTSNTVDTIKGSFTPGTVYTAVTPCNANSAPSTCPGPGYLPNSLGTINLKTGALGNVTLNGLVNPQGMIFVP